MASPKQFHLSALVCNYIISVVRNSLVWYFMKCIADSICMQLQRADLSCQCNAAQNYSIASAEGYSTELHYVCLMFIMITISFCISQYQKVSSLHCWPLQEQIPASQVSIIKELEECKENILQLLYIDQNTSHSCPYSFQVALKNLRQLMG